jgi:hypothetical protein
MNGKRPVAVQKPVLMVVFSPAAKSIKRKIEISRWQIKFFVPSSPAPFIV